MKKTYSEMTPAERLAERIAQNRAIEARAEVTKKQMAEAKAWAARASLADVLNELAKTLPEKDREGFLEILEKYPDIVRVKRKGWHI